MAQVAPETGRFLRVNRRYCELTGYSEAELLGTTVPAITHPDDRESDTLELRRLVRGEVPEYRAEKRYIRADGRIIWVSVTANLIRDEQGWPLRTMAIIEDISERKRTEAALREVDRRKDEFLATLSHELRNPLGAIRSGLFVLERSPLGSVEAKRAQTVITRQVDHLTRLVDELLDVSRVTHGKIRLEREILELGELVRRTLDDHHSAFAGRELQLDSRLTDEPLWIDADPTRIVQVVGNLLTNAAKFTPTGGRVELSLARAQDEGRASPKRAAMAELRVRDTGIGLDAAALDRVFEPFVQGRERSEDGLGRRSAGEAGLGLGLTLVKRLVELHGGTVEALSEGPARGTEFRVRLPLTEAPAERAQSLSSSARTSTFGQATGRRVLVIEDNVDVATTLGEALEVLGHQVVVTHDGLEGLALAKEFRPEVVLCDIGLPGMSGYEVAERFRADPQLRDTTLLALTGYASNEDKRKALAAGFARHVAKPLNLQALEQLLREA